MDTTGYLERVAMSYFKRLVLPAAVIGCLIVYEFTRERAAVYNMPVAQAHSLLRSAGLPDYVLGSEPKKFDLDSRDPGKIVWIVKDRGSEAMRFAALLSPISADSTEVRIEVSGPTSGAFGDMQRRLSEYRSIRHLYLMGMKERVAATLEGREFSIFPCIHATVIATLSAVFRLAVSHDPKAAANEEDARLERERQNIERAYKR